MSQQDVVKEIAKLQCSIKNMRPCEFCIQSTAARIGGHAYIDVELIETTAIAVANLNGNYAANLTSLEFDFALRLLEEIIPYFLEKIQETEVRGRLRDIKEKHGDQHS